MNQRPDSARSRLINQSLGRPVRLVPAVYPTIAEVIGNTIS